MRRGAAKAESGGLALAERLAAGGQLGLGCAKAVAREAETSPEMMAALVACVADTRAVVSRRAANALRTVAERRPELLRGQERAVLRLAGSCEDTIARWNVLRVVGFVDFKGRQRAAAFDLLMECVAAESGLERAFALTGLDRLAEGDAGLRARVDGMLRRAVEDPSAAVRARARRLLR